ncbi:MAG: putative DNA binding domain-containing protein [Desulfobacterales bacterium]|nr:putative DNA binding domain-containing protein [Desulfobacterales bacterium]MBF0395395.1 putative DNA binding domain-containing protein [Desulfobacterales bacterium]
MEASELIEIISLGEDSKHQHKINFTNPQKLSEEIIAFSNTLGGMIIIGVDDNGVIIGLTQDDIRRLNQMISNVASTHVRPPVNPIVENILINNKLIMIIKISEGISKPYMDNNGAIIVKNGADKRKVTSREEIQRMFQSAGLIHGDEIPANGITIADLDYEYFSQFLFKEYNEKIEQNSESLSRLLENMSLARDGIMNIAGALLFSKFPQFRLPVFMIKAVSYPAEIIDENNYIDSQDITGKLSDIFQKAIGFILNNLKRIQKEKGVNSTGELEIPRITLEELLINALVHRDYFISAPIRLFIFSDRIEILSPGHLPNNLTIENIKNGISNIRNPIIASFASKLLPYRGLGNGIRRALQAYQKISFFDDREGNLFKVVIYKQ